MDNRGFDQDRFSGGGKTIRPHQRHDAEKRGHNSLGDIAYAEIKRRIINLDFRPGDYLNEASVCAKLGMTRSPVHQAMQRLMHEGLVRVIPRKGVFVQPVTFDEVADVIDVRFLNEPYCVERATEAATAAELQEMTRILGRAASMIVARDIEGLMNLDRAFHRAIARAARNVVLADLLSTLHDRSLRFWFISLS
ncbi:MAG: GntR family transcriptional regulator, partial [Rhodospirillales bacterium]|nr:GntR family transcriptional regulator [Rhodospirillales bacterium]